jgi:hypothetical protein
MQSDSMLTEAKDNEPSFLAQTTNAEIAIRTIVNGDEL